MKFITLIVAVWFVVGAAVAGDPVPSAGKEVVVGSMAIARSGMEWDKDGKPTRLEFDFGDFTAWARKKGGWQLEGVINHSGLVCGTYYVMARFGTGNPGCENVKWFSDPKLVTQREHCNSASLSHQGGDIEFPWADRFDQVTCAERIIRCTGICRYTLGKKPLEAPKPQGGLGDEPAGWQTTP
jgi:hypothetical protein